MALRSTGGDFARLITFCLGLEVCGVECLLSSIGERVAIVRVDEGVGYSDFLISPSDLAFICLLKFASDNSFFLSFFSGV